MRFSHRTWDRDAPLFSALTRVGRETPFGEQLPECFCVGPVPEEPAYVSLPGSPRYSSMARSSGQSLRSSCSSRAFRLNAWRSTEVFRRSRFSSMTFAILTSRGSSCGSTGIRGPSADRERDSLPYRGCLKQEVPGFLEIHRWQSPRTTSYKARASCRAPADHDRGRRRRSARGGWRSALALILVVLTCLLTTISVVLFGSRPADATPADVTPVPSVTPERSGRAAVAVLVSVLAIAAVGGCALRMALWLGGRCTDCA